MDDRWTKIPGTRDEFAVDRKNVSVPQVSAERTQGSKVIYTTTALTPCKTAETGPREQESAKNSEFHPRGPKKFPA